MSDDPATSTPAQFIANEIESLHGDIRNLRVAPVVSSQEIRDRLEAYTFAHEVPLEESLPDVAEMLRNWTLHATHPRYFGLFVPNTLEAGIWADALTALYNPQVGAWWHSPAANEIDIHTLKFLADLIGVEAESAQFTSGGSEANLTALLAAIATAYPDALEGGVGEAASHGAVYVSSQAHHSIQKAARIAGLGNRVLRIIPCDDHHQMDVPALSKTVEMDIADGRKPIMIVGTLGTTTAGAIDDLEAIGKIARENNVWYHVDAAWGGTAAFSSQLRHFLIGISEADSLCWDAHKWLSVPMGAGMFFCRRAEVLRRVFGVDAAYVPKKLDEGDDLYLMSLQWSRRFIGLKVFLTLATVGHDGVARKIEHQLSIAHYFRTQLTSRGWIVVNKSPLPILCFTHPSLEGAESLADVAQHVVASGRAWISTASLPEGPVLRACITHDDTSPADIDVLCEELDRALKKA